MINRAPTTSEAPKVEREVDLLQTLRHPRIVNLMGVCRDMGATEGYLGLVLEMMETGSLYHILHDASMDAVAKRPSDLQACLKCCLDIAEGMRFLHHSNVLHRDLKSDNVLIDRYGGCKIADFGLSTVKDHTQTTGVMATPAWMAPEVMLGAKFSSASDMYSFGVIIWEIFTGEIPWPNMQLVTVVTLVAIQGQRLPVPETLPRDLKGLVEGCFGAAEGRATFDDACELLSSLLASNPRPVPVLPISSGISLAELESVLSDVVTLLSSHMESRNEDIRLQLEEMKKVVSGGGDKDKIFQELSELKRRLDARSLRLL